MKINNGNELNGQGVAALLANYSPARWLIVGGSCCGKDWLADRFVEAGCERLASYTTRALRPDEQNNGKRKLSSVSVELFARMEASGLFLATYCRDGVWYGLEDGYGVAVVDWDTARMVDGAIVECVASMEVRVERKMKRDGVGREEAEKVLRERDEVEKGEREEVQVVVEWD